VRFRQFGKKRLRYPFCNSFIQKWPANYSSYWYSQNTDINDKILVVRVSYLPMLYRTQAERAVYIF